MPGVTRFVTAALAAVVAGGASLRATDYYTPISIASVSNDSIAGRSSAFPTGSVLHAGVPFSIPTTGSNCYFAGIPSGSGTRTIQISVGLAGVRRVHMLLNTGWGQPGPASYVRIECVGSGGAVYAEDQVGGVDIRDWANGSYTTTITSPNTVNVFSSGVIRRDMRTITLPASFQAATLQTIRVIDTGNTNFQRVLVDGVTVVSDPPPVATWEVASGGNGHRYAARLVPAGITWADANATAQAEGGSLVTITSAAENAFVYGLVSGNAAYWYIDGAGNGEGPWLGGVQPAGSAEPAGGWSWVSGEPWGFTNWSPGEPNNNNGHEDRLIFFAQGALIGPRWNDYPGGSTSKGYIVEFPAPCGLADVVGIGGPPIAPDGLLTGDDFNAFIGAFAAGDLLADVVGIGGLPPPDGLITGDDFNAFVAAFAAGCP